MRSARSLTGQVDRFGLVTRSALIAGGWTEAAVRHALKSGRLHRMRPGVYLDANAPVSPLLAGLAVTLVDPVPVLSHDSAGVLHSLPIVGRPARGSITVPPGWAVTRLSGVRVHRAGLPRAQVVHGDGFRCTSVSRTVVDLARERGSDAGVAAADAALAQGVSPADLRTAVSMAAGWPGVRAARLAVSVADARSESPLESISQLRLDDQGLPRPELQVDIANSAGWFVAHVDFYWPEYGVVGEADGNDKYDRRDVLVDERRRQQDLEDLGLVVVRWEWRDLRQFEVVARRLRAAFERDPAWRRPAVGYPDAAMTTAVLA